ncbi:MAG: ATP-dependent RecD-like DNA helicase [Verrucomicrobiales bacterium]
MSDPSPQDTLIGTVERITFHNEENGFAILKVAVKGRAEPVTVKGMVAVVQPGERLEAAGQWVNDPNYGRQFAAIGITTTAPSSLDGIKRYLGSGLIDGIGPVYAERLVEKFGERVFDIIEHQSGRLLDVEGIGKKRRAEIKESWEKQKAVREIMVFLHAHGVSTARAVRIYKRYGDAAITTIRENPYRLADEVWGIGFKTADEIAGKLGIAKDALPRLRAGLQHVLLKATDDGHCALPVETLLEEAGRLLGEPDSPLDALRLQPALDDLLGRADLLREVVDGDDLIFLPHLLTAETHSAARLLNLASRPPEYPSIDVARALVWVEEKTGKKLADGQKAAIREALGHRILVITGGPGVGKTTILNSLLQILEAKGVDFVLAAPTGRAAKRLSESTGHEAKTLHRLLEYQPAKGWGRDADRPLKGTLFVLDEASMIDVPLLWHFLKALPAGAHLLLVGDVDQLPSVGPGRVLADIIASKAVPVARLTEIFRQARTSRIITAAHAVNAGLLPDLDPPADGTTSDFYFIERASPEEIAAALVQVIRDRIPQRFGMDACRDIQVLTPMNRGLLGASALNAALQEALNRSTEFTLEAECFGTLYRVGDKVIQTRNNYDKDVFNGDIGRITGIESGPLRVEVAFEDGRAARYESGELDELRLAYAITIHKSQGSEFPAVVIPVSTQHYMMLQRNLLYTGLTRGRKLVVLVGTKEALQHAVRRADSRRRWTTLRARLESAGR